MSARIWVGLLVLLVGLNAQALQVLDDDFFGSPEPRYTPGMKVLDSDFFRSRGGLLSESAPGEFGCSVVWANSARSESAALGKTIQFYCAGKPMVQWVPHYKRANFNSDISDGYFQVCCLRRDRARSRRPLP